MKLIKKQDIYQGNMLLSLSLDGKSYIARVNFWFPQPKVVYLTNKLDNKKVNLRKLS